MALVVNDRSGIRIKEARNGCLAIAGEDGRGPGNTTSLPFKSQYII